MNKGKDTAADGDGPDSDVDNLDFDNFKGIYFGDKTEKYQDPVTGCHFEYYDLCKRMLTLKQKRKILDKRLGLKTSSMLLSPARVEKEQQPKSKLITEDKKVAMSNTELQRVRAQ